MSGSAATRFWRGVREPWELMARMREDRPLWARYWRTVLVQATVTLLAGLAIFWVGKQGADAWNDAFGPAEPVESAVPASATRTGPGASTATPDAVDSPPAPGRPAPGTTTAPGKAGRAAATGSGNAPSPSPGETRSPPARLPGLPPPPGAPVPPSPPGTPSTAGTTAPGTEGAGAPVAPEPGGTAADEAEDTDETDSVETSLEEKIKALQDAPPDERSKRTAELVAAALEKAKLEASRAERAGKRKGKVAAATDDLADERDAVSEKLEGFTLAAEALARDTPMGAGEARRARRHLERELDRVEKDAAALQRRGAAPLSDAERARLERARAALQVVHRHERGLAGRLGAVLALLAAIYASLSIAQTGVLALTRDFHDALSRDLSLLVQVAPEDPPMRPKIRLDVPWVRRKANRRAQFFLGFLPGTALISVVGWLVPPHKTLATVLTTLWAAYWWTVMTAGRSVRAWTPPETTPRPWYLRAWFALTERVFLFRWGLPRWWGRIWERMARRFYGPSERVEEQPLEFTGLALSRAVTLIPVLKLLFRPLFPVCAARLMVEHAATARLPVPVTAAEVADAAAHAPDAEARAHSGVVTP